MVWGMALPSGFGEFWPDGDFEAGSWTQRLNAFYQEQSPEVQKALFDHTQWRVTDYPFYVVEKFTNEAGVKFDRVGPPLNPIKEHEAPVFFATGKEYKTLGSLIKLNDRIVAVDEALKAIIEKLELGIHKFSPMEIRMPRGQVFPKTYFTLVICQYFDSFSPEHSNEKSWHERGVKRYGYNPTKAAMSELAFSKFAFGDAHLWRERLFGEHLTCFSDELQSEIEKAGLRIPKHFGMKEV